MARFVLHDYISIGTGYMHTATSWQAGLDITFNVIIDEVFKSKKYLTKWVFHVNGIHVPTEEIHVIF